MTVYSNTTLSEFVLWSSIWQNSKSLNTNQTFLQSLTRFGRCYSSTTFQVEACILYYFYHFQISGHNICDHVEYYIDTGISNIWLACLSISGIEYPSLLLFVIILSPEFFAFCASPTKQYATRLNAAPRNVLCPIFFRKLENAENAQ